MVGWVNQEEVGMFVWSDELALMLRDEGLATTAELAGWITTPVAHRLREDEGPLDLARRLLETQAPVQRQAS